MSNDEFPNSRSSSPRTRFEEVVDRCLNASEAALEGLPYERLIVLLDFEGGGVLGGRCIDHQMSSPELIFSLLSHLRAVLKSEGKELSVVPMRGQG